MKNAVIEPRTGGRWYEIGEDSAQCDWGEVLGMGAAIAAVACLAHPGDWQFDPSLLTEVEINFIPLHENSTRVELEHRLLENLGDAAEATRQTFESEHGWVESGGLRG